MRLVNVKKSRGQRPQTYNTVMLSNAERSEVERGGYCPIVENTADTK